MTGPTGSTGVTGSTGATGLTGVTGSSGDPTGWNKMNHELLPFRVYPNPSSGMFYLYSTSVAGAIKDIKVYDIQGKLVPISTATIDHENLLLIDLNNNIKGMYFLKISTTNESYFERLIRN